MKTLNQVKAEIQSLINSAPDRKTLIKREMKELKKVRIKLDFLRAAEMYLETKPSEPFIRKQQNMVERKLSIVNNLLLGVSKVSTDKETKRKLEVLKKERHHNEEQLKMLSYLLKDVVINTEQPILNQNIN